MIDNIVYLIGIICARSKHTPIASNCCQKITRFCNEIRTLEQPTEYSHQEITNYNQEKINHQENLNF